MHMDWSDNGRHYGRPNTRYNLFHKIHIAIYIAWIASRMVDITGDQIHKTIYFTKYIARHRYHNVSHYRKPNTYRQAFHTAHTAWYQDT